MMGAIRYLSVFLVIFLLGAKDDVVSGESFVGVTKDFLVVVNFSQFCTDSSTFLAFQRVFTSQNVHLSLN